MQHNMSDNDTNESSNENIDEHSYSFSQIEAIKGFDFVINYRLNCIKYAFNKILSKFLPFHPQQFQKHLQKARQYLDKGISRQAKQQICLVLAANQPNNTFVFQRVYCLLSECSLIQNKTLQAKSILTKIHSQEQVFLLHQVQMLQIKICIKEGRYKDAQYLVNQVEKKIINNYNIKMEQKAQIILFCGQTYIQVEQYNQAYNVFLKWLPIFISFRNLQNKVFVKIYIKLAYICHKYNNLNYEYTYLSCAQLSMQNENCFTAYYNEVQFKKIKNLIARKMYLKAYQQHQKLMIALDRKMEWPKQSQVLKKQFFELHQKVQNKSIESVQYQQALNSLQLCMSRCRQNQEIPNLD